MMRVNVDGVFHAMQPALRRFQAQGSGRIVDIAATVGRFESAGQAAGNASKHAVVGLRRCAALEHAAEGITVNAICPGFVDAEIVQGMMAAAPDPARARAGMATRVPMGRLLDRRRSPTSPST